MAKHRLEAFLHRQCELLKARDADGLMALYKTPLPIYHGDAIQLRATDAELRYGTESFLRGMDNAGVVEVRHRLVGFVDQGGRFTVVAEFLYHDTSGKVVGRSNLKYFLEDCADGLSVVMVQYSRVAFGEVHEAMRARLS